MINGTLWFIRKVGTSLSNSRVPPAYVSVWIEFFFFSISHTRRFFEGGVFSTNWLHWAAFVLFF